MLFFIQAVNVALANFLDQHGANIVVFAMLALPDMITIAYG
jgi:hypothetical protein